MALNESPDEPFALVQPKAQPIRQERPAQPQTMAPGGGCNPALQQTPTDSKKHNSNGSHGSNGSNNTSQNVTNIPCESTLLRILTPSYAYLYDTESKNVKNAKHRSAAQNL